MAKISINIASGKLEKTSKASSTIVGIDLGTTNSLVAFVNPETGKSEVIKDESGSAKLLPSILHFAGTEISVGAKAKQKLVEDPANTIYSVKRLMGKAFGDLNSYSAYLGYTIIDDDSDSLVKIRVNDKFYTPIELSALILKELKKRVEKALDQTVEKAVITVPAYFNDSQRQATRDAGKLAGLEVLRIVNEPTAASLAYGIGNGRDDQGKKIAVYDLGGGTFDLSILSIEDGIFEVLSTNGDTFLGGDDFDRAIIDFWLNKLEIAPEEYFKNKSNSQAIRLLAEKAKHHLSDNETFSEKWNDQTFEITRAKFETSIKSLVDKTLKACKAAIDDAKLVISEIDDVVLIGGSTRVPYVKAQVEKLFNKKPHDQLDPDEVVALGAAIQADILAGNNKDFLLIDITPLSLGIETMGGLMDIIIPRNSKVPHRAARQYTTHVDGQANMKIAVFQGERDLIKDNRKLAEFHLKGIPGMPAGLAKVEIAFLIDADGILKVRAKELRSGVEQTIEIHAQYGLSETEMAKMLLDSIKNAESDMAARALQEAKVEGQQLIDTADRFLTKNAEFITEKEHTDTTNLMSILKEAIATTDKDLIQSKIHDLNEFTRPFAEKVMDFAISKAMKGKKIDS